MAAGGGGGGGSGRRRRVDEVAVDEVAVDEVATVTGLDGAATVTGLRRQPYKGLSEYKRQKTTNGATKTVHAKHQTNLNTKYYINKTKSPRTGKRMDLQKLLICGRSPCNKISCSPEIPAVLPDLFHGLCPWLQLRATRTEHSQSTKT